ncbi:MAG: hypothetical protein IJH79_19225, partial [Lentisphaeria bacterium]|nr:hypothetical protein [Lentisphaeria bacterium]
KYPIRLRHCGQAIPCALKKQNNSPRKASPPNTEIQQLMSFSSKEAVNIRPMNDATMEGRHIIWIRRNRRI